MKAVLLACLILTLTVSAAMARTWYIKSDGTGDAPTIQAGVNSADSGDTVLVAPGMYNEHDIGMKDGVCLASESGAGVTTIDGQGLDRVIYCGNISEASVIDGFTITGGSNSGIHCAPYAYPQISRNVIQYNSGEYGGGVYCGDGSSPTIISNVICHNSVSQCGGGVCARGWCSPSIIGNLIHDNTSDTGAGICVDGRYCSPLIEDNTITNNIARLGGGGVYSAKGQSTAGTSNPSVIGNTITGNTAREGGGILATSRSLIRRNEIAFNSVTEEGGGVFLGQFSADADSNLIDSNSADVGGGIYCELSDPTIRVRCNTVCSNSASSGAGFYFSSASPTISANIVAFSGGGEVAYCHGTSVPTFSCNDIWGNEGGNSICGIDGDGNFSADPQFCNAEGGDFTLCDKSPCLPGNHPDGYDCGLIGAFGEGCVCGPTAAEASSWGTIKSMYR